MNESPTLEECEERLSALPIFSEGGYVDGLDYGCRILHSTLSSFNPIHCPHISFVPVADINGKVKCQISLNIQVSDLFSEEDFALHHQYLVSEQIDPSKGMKIECEDSPEWSSCLGSTFDFDWVSKDSGSRCKISEASLACAATCMIKCKMTENKTNPTKRYVKE